MAAAAGTPRVAVRQVVMRTRVLVIALVVQIVLGGLLIWAAATGFSFIPGLHR